MPAGPNATGIPPIEINGLTRLGSSPWRPQYQISQVWQVLDNLSWLKGDHSLKFGYESCRNTNNFLDIRSPQGEIIVSGIYTTAGSFGLPDFLLGDVDTALFTTPTVVHNYQLGNSFYGQDSWRANSKLTVTYGVRYELFSPLLNRQNQLANFSPANGGELISATQTSDWYGRSQIHPDKNDWAPRFGFAYHAAKPIVLRGGYGVFYQHSSRIGSESILALNPPFVTSFISSQILGSSTPAFQLQSGFPSFSAPSTSLDLSTVQVRAQDPNQRTGYVHQFSFGPEIQLSSKTSLELSYVGNLGRKLNRLRNANQGLVSGYDASGNPVVTYPYANLNSATNHSFLELATNDGNTNYHALLVSLRHRYSNGLTYGVSYTWSHNIADFVDHLTGAGLPQNAYNYAGERGDSANDVRHRFVAYAGYELPIGRGKWLLNNDRLISRIVGGGR